MGEVPSPAVEPVRPNLIGKRPWQSPLEGNPWLIGAKRWQRAERAAMQIVAAFRPTDAAERKRVEIIMYLQHLLRLNFNCDVFAYGSVPLKTFLPDGDIDLTAVGPNNDEFVKDIASLLEYVGKSRLAKFVITDVRLINAEVKLVKCIIENIVVDISIYQIGGLCTLCFLEQVDRTIQKNHVFKESIILIKAWCYYESRTLGAHAGLISTYGLEILVLYIFHVFHRTLDGPLSVLYKFLEYFSTFDWDNCGISLMGPVKISALPEIVVEEPPNNDDLLLGGNFLKYCLETLSVPKKGGNGFPVKHLNIIDPLKDDNNLGRSINKANSMRIRSAFTYGARKLGEILIAREGNVSDKLRNFFSNTMTLHGGGRRPDLQDPRGLRTGAGAEKTFSITATGQPRSPSDQNASAGSLGFCGRKTLEASLKTFMLTPVNLAGDLKAYLLCLWCARWWYAYAFAVPGPPPPPPLLITMTAMEHAHYAPNFERNGVHHDGNNRWIIPHPGFHSPDPMLMARPPFGPEEPNPWSTLIYIPAVTSPRTSGFLVDQDDRAPNPDAPGRTLSPNTSGSIPIPEPGAELVPIGPPVEFQGPFSHRTRPQNPNQTPPPEQRHRPSPASRMQRLVAQTTYHLKDDDDFPPLAESSRKPGITH